MIGACRGILYDYRAVLRVGDRPNRVLVQELPVKHNRLWLWLSSNTIGCVCRRAGYAQNKQGEHCDTIVFSSCPLAGLIDSLGYDRSSHTSGLIDSLGDTRLDKMLTRVFLDQLQEVLAGLVSGRRNRSRSIRLRKEI